MLNYIDFKIKSKIGLNVKCFLMNNKDILFKLNIY